MQCRDNCYALALSKENDNSIVINLYYVTTNPLKNDEIERCNYRTRYLLISNYFVD